MLLPMPQSYGVRCHNCGEHIHIEWVTPDTPKEITFYCVPLTPVPCTRCGQEAIYTSKQHQFRNLEPE
jgi:DNA-directed RNA polymerase subunit RPC12/RpoP